jgi:type III secretory pathway component EscS
MHCVLFTSNSFVYWMKLTNDEDSVLRSHEASLAGFPNGPVTGDYFRAMVKTFLWVLIPVSWVFLTLMGLLVCLIQAYIFSLAASLLERGLPHGLKLPQLLNVALHAVAPAAIILTAYKAMWLEGVDVWLIYLVAYGIFLIGASSACRDKQAASSE